MKYFFLFILLLYTYQSEIFAQDLLIVTNNDSIPCKIKDIDDDGSIYYKSIMKYDLYNGYLKRENYSEIINDYYTKLKRHSNPNNGLGIIGLGIHYIFFPFNPIIEKFIDDEKLYTELSRGFTFTLSYRKFSNPIKKFYYKEVQHTNFSYGMDFSFFRQNADSEDIKRQFERISLPISYNTNFKHTTYITIKPGLIFNHYWGSYDDTPIKSRSAILNMGLGVDQKLLDITNDFSLFLSCDLFCLAAKSGKIDYKRVSYVSTPTYSDWQYDHGFSIGLAVKYFY